jgi:hypothetical protein
MHAIERKVLGAVSARLRRREPQKGNSIPVHRTKAPGQDVQHLPDQAVTIAFELSIPKEPSDPHHH